MILSLLTRSLPSRIAMTVLAITGISIAVLLGLTWYSLEEFAKCRMVVLKSTPSPDGTEAVFVFRQECNATVPDSTYASIAPTNQPFSPDINHAFLGLGHAAEVLSSWRGNDVVEIALIPSGDHFIKREEKVGNIEIDYK